MQQSKNTLQNAPVLLYEVFRVQHGIPLFLEDHLERLKNSVRLSTLKHTPDIGLLKLLINNLITDQNKEFGNIKISLEYQNPWDEPICSLNFIPHYYPTQEEYLKGVKTGLLHANRPNPNAKVQHSNIKKQAELVMNENRYFEVLLVDSEGSVTEGSRSNVLFIKGDTVYTAPPDKILKGITLLKVLKICQELNIRVVEKPIPLTPLNQFDGACLTGTSPKVLPICAIANLTYSTDLPLTRTLMEAYNQLIDRYIQGS